MASASNVPKPRTLKKWTAEFKWLEIRENRMYCRLCTKWQKKLASCRNYSDAFITKGSNNWQRSAVNEHNTSAMHSDANGHENREILGDQFRKHVVHTISSLKRVYERFKPLLSNDINLLQLETQYLSLMKYVLECMGNAVSNVMDPITMWQTLKKIKGESFPEIFLVIEICLCSPFSNATLERFFSHMGVMKTDWRNRLNEQSLEDNLRIHVAGPDLTKFSETYVAKAVKAWYNDRPRRVHQKKRKKYKQRATSKKPNADLGLDLADICNSGGEDSSSSDCESESGSSETD